MKKLLLIALSCLFSLAIFAQENGGLKETKAKIESRIKNQEWRNLIKLLKKNGFEDQDPWTLENAVFRFDTAYSSGNYAVVMTSAESSSSHNADVAAIIEAEKIKKENGSGDKPFSLIRLSLVKKIGDNYTLILVQLVKIK